MADPYIGELRIFAGNFAPRGWAFCNGQLMPISQYDALFTLIGTTYGGDGVTTFGMPDLRGRLPLHQGQGPGLSNNHILGEQAGTESVTLTVNQIPAHSHQLLATTATGTAASPQNAVPAAAVTGNGYRPGPAGAALAAQTVSPAGGSQPHENRQPFLCVSFIICLEGIFPTQN